MFIFFKNKPSIMTKDIYLYLSGFIAWFVVTEQRKIMTSVFRTKAMREDAINILRGDNNHQTHKI